ncbi:PREDICTED: ER degradation-enhancing alpha-mannosidase-like protein 3 [Diuraphis noxia]|uniref:ER degradation-enhancing alpha-mannosidase-like protein 3 n=1 Tax=Diuraphis noxia TaxID=143948 RepID=UPI000763A40B|nr:PREDICTED: ER degradation-enhancing alpha-mannosidase-like protein 3 [Diuraphis noxia]
MIKTLGLISLVAFATAHDQPFSGSFMSKEEKLSLMEKAKEMFYHAYTNYMEHAYPADELMPLSCKGRWRTKENNRGDMDDVLGNYSLTLIDTMDTLVVLGDLPEFDRAVSKVVTSVTFDRDVVVSVFEINIRVLGGLLSGHIFAQHFKENSNHLQWYNGELLTMAKDLGYRLMPAFNTTTGIPYSRVNLKYGIKRDQLHYFQETCTACAGSMILELAALSRLSGIPIFEEKAHRSMDSLWSLRHRSSNLMGTVLNVDSGDWIRRDSGVGAGIDSYYEYCLKAYVLLGESRYLSRFNKHYAAIMKYISQGPMLLDVHMHRPQINSKNFMDALLAFWPGLQVLSGDLKPAIETHEMLYQVVQKHNFIPEAFTTDFQVHWGQHPLRPEFLESTYFLYKATGDPHYLNVGRQVLNSLQKYARVECGFAAVKDVRTTANEDTMDSFVLAETFKYLYLLFAESEDLIINIDEYLFTTEGHLLPLYLSVQPQNYTDADKILDEDNDLPKRSCPSFDNLLTESIRKPLKNMVDGLCPNRKSRIEAREFAKNFQFGNENHMQRIKAMGIVVTKLPNGLPLLFMNSSHESNPDDQIDGHEFLTELNIIMKDVNQKEKINSAKSVSFDNQDGQKMSLYAGAANFGLPLNLGLKVEARIAIANPVKGCETLLNPSVVKDKIVLVERGDCMFIEKARKLQEAGAVGGIVIDNATDSSVITSRAFSMSDDGIDDVSIPLVFLFASEARPLLDMLNTNPDLLVTISELPKETEAEIDSVEDTGTMINNSIDKLKKIIGDIMTSNDPTQDQVSDLLKWKGYSSIDKQTFLKLLMEARKGIINKNDDIIKVDELPPSKQKISENDTRRKVDPDEN